MSKTVFIIGAGASAKAGVPLMNGFLDTAEHILTSGKVEGPDREHFDAVFKGLHSLQGVFAKSQLDTYNLEAVFIAFEMAGLVEKLDGFTSDAVKMLSTSMRRVIVKTIEKTMRFPSS